MTSWISSSVSAIGRPNCLPGRSTPTSDGPFGCGLTERGVWRPACEICIQKPAPPERAACTHARSDAIASASGGPR